MILETGFAALNISDFGVCDIQTRNEYLDSAGSPAGSLNLFQAAGLVPFE